MSFKRLVYSLLIALVNVPLSALQTGMNWMPSNVGDRWVYQYEWKTGDPQHPTVSHWEIEESNTGAITIPEGLVILRQQRVNGQPPVETFVLDHGNGDFLLHNSCVYFLDRRGYGEAGKQPAWNSVTRVLNREFRENLSKGAISPDMCFPLEQGKTWGTSDVSWRVEGLHANDGSIAHPYSATAYHVVCDHFGSGGRKDIWFSENVGIVLEKYVHQGTYESYTKRLIHFNPGTIAHR